MITVVRAGAADVELVLEAGELFDEPPVREHALTFLSSPGHHLLLALDGGRPVGFVSGVEMVHPDKGTELCVYELGTHEDRRREGIATTLLAELTRLARERGCYGMWVGTEADNLAAHATYVSAGFTGPEPVVHFERRLG